MSNANASTVITDTKQDYDAWHARHAVDEDADAPWHLLVRHHLRLDVDVAGRRVLEIGCGRGGFSCWLAAQALPPCELTAADFSDTAVDKGRKFARCKGLDNISWRVADIQRLPFAEATFDTAISCETVEHVPEPARALRELARVLRSGGRLFLTTPNYFSTTGLWRLYLPLRGRRFSECGQPINHFTLIPRTLTWLRRAGLRVVTVDAIGHYIPFPGRRPIHLPRLDDPRFLMKWFAVHSMFVAVKP